MTGVSLRKAGCLMLREVRSSGLLGARTEHVAKAMGVKELIERTSEVARANVLDVVDVDPDGSFRFNVIKARDKNMGHLIKTLRHDAESGAPVIEFYPADGARKVLGKWAGLGEKNAPPAGPSVQVMVNVLGSLPAEVQASLFRALLASGQGNGMALEAAPLIEDGPDADDTEPDP